MTCIVGLEHPSGAVIGGDAAYTSGWRRTDSAAPKVFRLGPLLIGSAGSTRVAQIMEYRMLLPEPEPTVDWMVTVFVQELRRALSEDGCLECDRGVESMHAQAIIGIADKIFTLWGDMQVEPASRGYQAVGNGDQIAVGALHVLTRSRLSPVVQVRRALEASAAHIASVGPPFTVLRTRRGST